MPLMEILQIRSSLAAITLAQFASMDCLFRMNGLGSLVEADWGCGVFLSCVFMR